MSHQPNDIIKKLDCCILDQEVSIRLEEEHQKYPITKSVDNNFVILNFFHEYWTEAQVLKNALLDLFASEDGEEQKTNEERGIHNARQIINELQNQTSQEYNLQRKADENLEAARKALKEAQGSTKAKEEQFKRLREELDKIIEINDARKMKDQEEMASLKKKFDLLETDNKYLQKQLEELNQNRLQQSEEIKKNQEKREQELKELESTEQENVRLKEELNQLRIIIANKENEALRAEQERRDQEAREQERRNQEQDRRNQELQEQERRNQELQEQERRDQDIRNERRTETINKLNWISIETKALKRDFGFMTYPQLFRNLINDPNLPINKYWITTLLSPFGVKYVSVRPIRDHLLQYVTFTMND